MKNTFHFMMGISAIVAAMGVSASFAGTDVQNGGDGIYVNGKLVLRDFLGADAEIIRDNKAFLENIPEFMGLVKDIAKVHPQLAVQIYENVRKPNIWLTKAALPMLPVEMTTIAGTGADAQIAIRDEHDIIISLPLFNNTEREYLLLHEALHGMVRGDGAFKHAKVRQLTNYIKVNRNSLKRVEMDSLLDKLGVYQMSIIWHSSQNAKNKQEAILSFLLLEQGDLEARCAIIDYQLKKNNGFYNFKIENYGKYASCRNIDSPNPRESRFDYLKQYYAISDIDIDAIPIPFVYGVSPRPKFWKDWEYRFNQEQCEKYAGAKIKKEIDKAASNIEQVQANVQLLETIAKTEMDPARLLYLKTVLTEEGFDNDLQSKVAELSNKARTVYETNQKRCKDTGYLE